MELVDAREQENEASDLCGLLRDIVLKSEAAVLVGHGLAVPLALRVASELKLPVVLSNGPIRQLDPVVRTLALLPESLLSGVFLRAGFLNRWMASSLGMRRVVVNPYVMDRDTVALLLEPIVQSAASRRMAARWIRSLPSLLELPPCDGFELLLVWGDDDRFYPLAEAEFLLETASQGQLSTIEGGRYFHPVERPWELADAVGAFLEAHSL